MLHRLVLVNFFFFFFDKEPICFCLLDLASENKSVLAAVRRHAVPGQGRHSSYRRKGTAGSTAHFGQSLEICFL